MITLYKKVNTKGMPEYVYEVSNGITGTGCKSTEWFFSLGYQLGQLANDLGISMEPFGPDVPWKVYPYKRFGVWANDDYNESFTKIEKAICADIDKLSVK